MVTLKDFTHKEVEVVVRALQLVHQRIRLMTGPYELKAYRKGVQGARGSLELLAAGVVSFYRLEVRFGIELAGVVAWALSRCSLGVTAKNRRRL
jgi:hypothetical protein